MRAPHRVFRSSIALAALLTTSIAHAQSTTHATQALALLDAQKCEEAVAAVNDGMRADEPKSHFVAGQMFQNGYCLVRNVPRAMRIYERGALLGDRDSARSVAVVHARGDGVPQSYPQAARWYAVMRRDRVGIAAPPVDGFTTPEIAVRTYIEAVHDLAVGLMTYPRDAIEKGVTGTVKVGFDPRVGRVRLLSSTDNVGPTAAEPNRHDFERVLLAGYADAIHVLPRPSMSPNVDNSSEREVAFDRKSFRPDQPVGLQALAR